MPVNETELSQSLLEQLKTERLILLHTIDATTNGSTSSVISWVFAVDQKTIRIAIDQRSRLVENIRNNDLVTFTVFASATVYEIMGKATIIKEALDHVPFKLTCVEITISSVRDAMFYGSRISVEPEYEKIYDKRAAEKLDGQVFLALEKA